MSFQIKPDRKETENKTIRFPVSLIAQIEETIQNAIKQIEDRGIKEINSVHYWGGETLLYFDSIKYLFNNINRFLKYHTIFFEL